MNPSKSLHPQRILILFILMFFLLTSLPTQGRGAYILNADDIQAKIWMKLDPEKRASFVMGFLAGLDHVYNSMGLIVTLNRALSAKELSAEVYTSLLNQPELRAGPIDKIILNALDHVISITNKNGNRVSPDLRDVVHTIP